MLQQRGDTDDAVVPIPPEDVQKIFEHPASPAIRNELVIRLLYQTDVRSVELANIELADIDFGKLEMRITSAKTNVGDGNYIRYVSYHKNLAYLMRKWVEKPRQSYGSRLRLPLSHPAEAEDAAELHKSGRERAVRGRKSKSPSPKT